MAKDKVRDSNKLSSDQVTNKDKAMCVAIGNPEANKPKTSGIKIRGTGAATKGVMARGPMG